MNDLTQKVLMAIADHNMIERGSAVTVALSGGADSVSLLRVLKDNETELGITVSACHVNHRLRGEDSDSDMRFCEDLCKSLKTPLKVLEVDVKEQRRNHESIEECARRVRYDFFEKFCVNGKLATAHNSNDSTETVLLNMLRGTGLKGLCGVPPVRGNIIRPLIYCTRAEIEEYCAANDLEYVTDKTNLNNDYTRNKLRHIVIPELIGINPSLLEAMSRMRKNLSEDSSYLEELAEKARDEARCQDGYSAKCILTLPAPIKSRVIKLILAEGGVEPSALRINTAAELLEKGEGKFNPCRDRFVALKRGVLRVFTQQQHYKKHENINRQ